MHTAPRVSPEGAVSVTDLLVTNAMRAVGGSVDNGKSSLISVLTHGVDSAPLLDDGRGRARTAVSRHKHEIQSGHTSSVSQCMLGFDSQGRVLNYRGVARLTTAEISAAADKVLHFIDLGGHARFLKTALYGARSTLWAEEGGGAECCFLIWIVCARAINQVYIGRCVACACRAATSSTCCPSSLWM